MGTVTSLLVYRETKKFKERTYPRIDHALSGTARLDTFGGVIAIYRRQLRRVLDMPLERMVWLGLAAFRNYVELDSPYDNTVTHHHWRLFNGLTPDGIEKATPQTVDLLVELTTCRHQIPLTDPPILYPAPEVMLKEYLGELLDSDMGDVYYEFVRDILIELRGIGYALLVVDEARSRLHLQLTRGSISVTVVFHRRRLNTAIANIKRFTGGPP